MFKAIMKAYRGTQDSKGWKEVLLAKEGMIQEVQVDPIYKAAAIGELAVPNFQLAT
jgi:hypothetical protein